MLDKQLTDAETSADATATMVDPAVASRVAGEKPSLGGDDPEQCAEGSLCLNTLPEDASLSQVVARLNDLLIAMHFVYAGGVVDRDTLAMVNAKTKLMRGMYKKPARLAAEPEPKFGEHESDIAAIAFVKAHLKAIEWRPNTRYPKCSRIVDALMAEGLTDRNGRTYNQQQCKGLARLGGYQNPLE